LLSRELTIPDICTENNFQEYLIQHYLKSGGTKDHFRRIKVPGTAPYCKACKSLHEKVIKSRKALNTLTEKIKRRLKKRKLYTWSSFQELRTSNYQVNGLNCRNASFYSHLNNTYLWLTARQRYRALISNLMKRCFWYLLVHCSYLNNCISTL
jgi:hypothetical protein